MDEGDYTCIAENKAGEKAEEVSLNVFGKRITQFIKKKKTQLWLFFSSCPFLLYFLTFAVQSCTALLVAGCRVTQHEEYSLKKIVSY